MSIGRRIFLTILIIFGVVLQVSFFPQFKIFGAQPDIILVISIMVAVSDGPVAGALVGFCGGMLQDMASPQVMGVNALTKAVSAYAAGSMKDFFMTYSILLPALMVFSLTFFDLFLYDGVFLVLGQEKLAPFNLWTLLVASVYNLLLAFPLYPLIRKFQFQETEDVPGFVRRT